MKIKIIILLLFPVCLFAQPKNETNIADANIYFSNQPFGASNSGARTTLSTNEFIYGHLEVQNTTVKDFFKITTSKDEPLPYVVTDWRILKNGEETYYSGTTNNYILLKNSDQDRNYLNFDVMPDPGKITTLYSMTTDFSAGLGFFPIYQLFDENHFPNEGTYQVEIKLYSKPTNACYKSWNITSMCWFL